MNQVIFNKESITPSKVVCIGRNYVAHIEELNNEVPDEPVVFIKPNSAIGSCLFAKTSHDIHYEGEICFLVQHQKLAGIGIGLDLTKRDVQTQLKTIKEDAIRQLRDKKDLFSGDGNSIKFGKHFFSVNKQKLDLTMVPKEGAMFYHLTGTGFFEEVSDAAFLETKNVWEQAIVSENTEVYRSEYLAYIAMKNLLQENRDLVSEEVLQYIQEFSANRYQEGYSKGIHDQDSAKILDALLYLSKHIDLLNFDSEARAMSNLYWQKFASEENKTIYDKQLKSAGIILQVFPDTTEYDFLLENLEESLRNFARETELFEEHLAASAALYLFKEISRHDHFIISGEAHKLQDEFKKFL